MFKITNNGVGSIVLNKLNIVLSSKGSQGDSAIIDDASRTDREIIGLERVGVVSISKIKASDVKKKIAEVVEKPKAVKKTKSPKAGSGPDGKGNKATFVKDGKVKTGKMVQSIEQGGSLQDPVYPNEDESPDPAFV